MSVTDAEIDRLRAALEVRPEIAFAYLFGSGSSGPRHRLSDVDIAVFVFPHALEPCEERKTVTDLWLDLLGVAERALRRDDIDVVLLHRAPPLLADRVARTGKVLFSRDEPSRIRWMVETKSRYCDLKPLREIGARSREEFLDDSTSQHAAAWCLQRAIQAVLDIGAHILAESGLVDWEEYREIPKRLARDCALPGELAARLEKAAGQRNILVHMYVEVDPELIYKTLQEGLDAFNEFAEYVLRVLEG